MPSATTDTCNIVFITDRLRISSLLKTCPAGIELGQVEPFRYIVKWFNAIIMSTLRDGLCFSQWLMVNEWYISKHRENIIGKYRWSGGVLFPASSWCSPHGARGRPSPTSLQKDEEQNFQESENLIYLKEKEKSQLCVLSLSLPSPEGGMNTKSVLTCAEISLLKSNENQWTCEPEQIHYMLTQFVRWSHLPWFDLSGHTQLSCEMR